MDKIRVVLVSAFILVSFILASEFAQFKNSHDREQVAEKYSASNANEKNSQDIPLLEQNDSIEEKPSSDAVTAKTINVKTDALNVTIDLFGGDLINISLPKYLMRSDTPNIPFELLEKSSHRTYIAQSGITGKNATDLSAKDRPVFKSAKSSYTLADNKDSLSIDLTFQQNDVSIIKRFTFTRGSYLINVEYIIDNHGNTPWEGALYGQIKRDDSKDPSLENGGKAGATPYLGFATTTDDERFKKIKFKEIDENKTSENTHKGGWIAMIQHYFLSAWIPDASQDNKYSTIKSKTGFYLARFRSTTQTIKPGEKGTLQASFYAGPKNQYVLEKISEGLDLSVDYGVLWMIAQPLYALLYFFNKGDLHAFGTMTHIFGGIGNWGFSIILLTLFVKACFFTLNAKAYNSMAKMRAIQPKMLEIRERYADDKQQQSKEIMSLYSKEGVNPLGGCLPIFIQMPVFLSLYWVLQESVELRQAPFIGYIHDLSSMDPYFIMPVIMGISMFVQQKLNPPPPDPMQAKVMQFLPFVFTFFFAFFPSGLVLYWIVNNVLSITQQWIITRRIEANIAKK